MVSKGQFVGLDWNRITWLHSQVMIGTQEVRNSLTASPCHLKAYPRCGQPTSKVSCQICYSCDFCDICHGCFQLARNILVTFAIFAILADFSGLFLVSSFSKTRVLLNLLFLRFLRHLSRVFSARKKNPCQFCDFCDICGHFVALLGFFFLSLEFDPGHISDSVSQTPRYYHLRNNWKIKRYTSYASYWRLSENHFVQKTRRCLVSCCTMNTLMLELIF